MSTNTNEMVLKIMNQRYYLNNVSPNGELVTYDHKLDKQQIGPGENVVCHNSIFVSLMATNIWIDQFLTEIDRLLYTIIFIHL